MAKREFVQLAQVFDSKHHGVGGWVMSEKLDGQRAIWDGGVSRGLLASEVPWANTAKDHIRLVEPVATGLWSRYGKVIHAPDSWLDALPPIPLDGELYTGNFQDLSSIVKRLPENRNNADWATVKYYVIDSPRYEELFADGVINGTNFKKALTGTQSWLRSRVGKFPTPPDYFTSMQVYLQRKLEGNRIALPHQQEQLPYNNAVASEHVFSQLNEITDRGGEGLMLRNPASIWTPARTWDLLKVKRMQDAEAVIVGYTTGRATSLGSKLRGLMGAAICKFQGKTFELSGFTDEERELSDPNWAWDNPETICPDRITNHKFPRGSVVKFRYRELTNEGLPKEARYLRKKG